MLFIDDVHQEHTKGYTGVSRASCDIEVYENARDVLQIDSVLSGK